MSMQAYRSGGWWRTGDAALLLALVLASVQGKAWAVQTNGATDASGSGQAMGQRITLDRVVAVVNSDLVLESDVEAERRFMAFQPFSEPAGTSQDQLVERLIDRDLIVQQMKLQPEPAITDAEVDEQLATLRKTIPECAAYHCETDAGWAKFIAAQGFTLQEVRDRWRVRMDVLRFIEERFRMGIRISQPEVDEYYQKTMLPTYEKQKVKAPEENTIADRIQEILLQQRVTTLLEDWLKTLRAQGNVKMVKPGEELP